MLLIASFTALVVALVVAAWDRGRALAHLRAAELEISRLRPLAEAKPAAPNTKTMRLMGLVTDGDKPVTMPAREWEAVKLALWRDKVGWEIAKRSAAEVIDHCQHAPECAGSTAETAPCKLDCPDREIRMSALVILNAARQHEPADVRRPADQPYFAPSRERFSEVMASLYAAQTELEALRRNAALPPPSDDDDHPPTEETPS